MAFFLIFELSKINYARTLMLKKNRWFWIVAVIGLILNQVTKYITVQSFEQIGDTFPIIPGFCVSPM
jgi:lipoprotein signal peptidase